MVYGVGYDGDFNNPNNWKKALWKVGLEGMNRQPTHK